MRSQGAGETGQRVGTVQLALHGADWVPSLAPRIVPRALIEYGQEKVLMDVASKVKGKKGKVREMLCGMGTGRLRFLPVGAVLPLGKDAGRTLFSVRGTSWRRPPGAGFYRLCRNWGRPAGRGWLWVLFFPRHGVEEACGCSEP